jgi:tRNA1Val (adenine37-N6)-methyltransferase
MFRFKQFSVKQNANTFKIGTDSVLLGSWACIGQNQILDVGTGTGIISLMLAQRYPDAVIKALEIHPDSAELANFNFANSKFRDRLSCINDDFLKSHFSDKIDHIISNPPYFKNSTKSKKLSNARHDDLMSLDAFFEKSASVLTEKGDVQMILPIQRLDDVLKASEQCGFSLDRLMRVKDQEMSAAKRILMHFSFDEKQSHLEDELILKNEDGSFHEQYKDLTNSFHPFL